MSVPKVTPELQMLPVASIVPNVNNPRKHFDKAALKDLAKTIAEHGVLEPLLCRPDPLDKHGKKFEIIFGERRWRAAKLAERAEIPVIVRSDIDDQKALEMMVIENDQREDVHPLEQSRGYQALIAGGYTREQIAEKVGKSVE